MCSFAARAIHPRPERRGFPRILVIRKQGFQGDEVVPLDEKIACIRITH